MSNLNAWLLWSVKITAALFNAPSTGYVFYGILEKTDRSEPLVLFNTLLAVLLIDLFFLWVLTVLEDSTLEPIKRLPMALSSILLSVAIIVIGFADEGILSYAPRVGLLALVVNDLVGWGTEWWRVYNSREQVEKRIHNQQIIKRRQVKANAYKRAIQRLSQEIEDNYYSKELGLLTNEPSEQTEPDQLPEYILQTDSGYGWVEPFSGEEHFEKSTGGEYTTLRGAQIALARHIKGHTNGHNLQ